MVRIKLVIFFCFIVPATLQAQVDRYVVYLKDKNGTPYSITNPSQFLSQRSIDRRAHQKIDVTAEDLPVTPDYRTQLQATGANVFFSSKWLNCVLVETTPAIITTVKALPFVSKVELAAPGKKLSAGRVKKFKKVKETSATPTTNTQLSMIGLDSMHQDGFRGEGIYVGVFDSGFDGVNTALPFKPIFDDGRLLYSFDFVANSKNVFQYDSHGTEVFSVIAAYSPGSFIGGAYKANYMLFVTEDVSSEYRIEEFNWLFAAEKADSAGVDVINSSLGYNLFDDSSMDYKVTDLNGTTAIVSLAASKALEKGMVVVCSAGNEGSNSWKYVTPPADVNGVLAIGSVNAAKVRSSFSSIGPTADGRIKPDVMALGSSTSVITPSGSIGYISGTSLASPLVASLVTGLWQRYPHLTAREIAQTITNTADQYLKPDNQKGYGIPYYPAVKNYLDVLDIDGDLVIYPNPTNDTLKVALKKPEGQRVVLSTFNVEGKLLSEYTVTVTWQNNPFILDLTSLAAGVYFVKVKVEDTVKTFRLVKI